MALSHIGFGEPASVGPLGSQLRKSVSHALFKSSQLEVIRWVLPAGEGIPAHRIAGESVLQCIEGQVRVGLQGHEVTLDAGKLLHLPPDTMHHVQAIEDASVLATLVLA
jgi:quercetin dioxygenase-like cupin family protein